MEKEKITGVLQGKAKGKNRQVKHQRKTEFTFHPLQILRWTPLAKSFLFQQLEGLLSLEPFHSFLFSYVPSSQPSPSLPSHRAGVPAGYQLSCLPHVQQKHFMMS